MKRKFKLFATVASLCLSVALMAFGVYAASTVTYTVSGSVTFTSQLAVEWTGKVEGGLLEAAVSDTTHTSDGTEAADPAYTWSPTTVQFGAGEGENVITYTFTCTNKGADDVKVSAAINNSSWFGDTNLTIKTGAVKGAATSVVLAAADSALDSTSTTPITLAQNEVWSMKIEITLNDVTKALNSDDCDFSVVLTATK